MPLLPSRLNNFAIIAFPNRPTPSRACSVDADRVDLSNLHRQVMHFTHDIGRPKTQSARRTLEDINPDITVVPHQTVLTSENALEILADYDVVVNGSDNFPTRYLVNDA